MTTIESPDGRAFARFMAGPYGRFTRVALGATLIGLGLFVLGKPLGFGLAAFGLVPIATGVLNLCPVAPVWGGHFIGAKYCARK